jgi:hypothetical protein
VALCMREYEHTWKGISTKIPHSSLHTPFLLLIYLSQ